MIGTALVVAQILLGVARKYKESDPSPLRQSYSPEVS